MNVSPPAEPLWDWSLRAMEAEPALRALLTLQDAHGLNGSLMLWAAWCDRARLALTDEDAERIIGGVHDLDRYIVRRLREVRRHAASSRPGFDEDGMRSLRRDVYRAELAAECLLQGRLSVETLAICDLAGDEDDVGHRLFAACARALETPVLLADDLGAAGPDRLFATLMAHAPPLIGAQPAAATLSMNEAE